MVRMEGGGGGRGARWRMQRRLAQRADEMSCTWLDVGEDEDASGDLTSSEHVMARKV